MDKKTLDILVEEYKNLSSAVEEHCLQPYKAIPVTITIVGAIAIYSVDKLAVAGLLVLYGLLLLVCWVAYVYGPVNAMGLRLVELEIRINRALGLGPQDGLGWYTKFIGDGMRVLPGFLVTSFVVTVVGLTFAGISLWVSWPSLLKMIGNKWLCFGLTALPFIATFGLVANMAFIDWHIRRKKRELLKSTLSQKDSCTG